MKNRICRNVIDVASRECKCPCCGNPIFKGEVHVKSCTPKRKTGYHLHTDCMTDLRRQVWDCEDDFNTESNSDSYTCRNHRAVVYASIDDIMYFKGENTMHGKKLNKTWVRYKSDYKSNRQSIGPILSTCFKHGLRVFIQFDDDRKLIEVFNKVEYTKLTDINK